MSGARGSPSGRPPVVVIGLDSADPATLRRLAAEGRLPSLAAALERGRAVELRCVSSVFAGAVWPSIATGRGPGGHGVLHYRQLRPGSLELVPEAEAEVRSPFWRTAAAERRRVLVVDVPIAGRPPGEDGGLGEGSMMLEWGPHPPLRPPASWPPPLAAEVLRRYGRHPCPDDDPYLRGVRALRRARDRIAGGAALRSRLVADLLSRGPFDLVVAVFAEIHVAGHQFANVDDPGHPCRDPAVAAALGGSPLEAVYEAVDRAVGSLLARLPGDATVLLASVSSVCPTYGGSGILPELLERLGLLVRARAGESGRAKERPGAGRRLRRRLLQAWRAIVPERLRAAVARRVPEATRARIATERLEAEVDWARTRAFAIPNEFAGYVRLHVRGREPGGIVAPDEREGLRDRIATEVRALRIAGTGEPAALDVIRCDRAFPGECVDWLPDLAIVWNSGRPIPAVASASVGRIENRDPGRRPGHRDDGLLLAWGPGIADGPPLAGARVEDLAPTVLALLGVTPPPGIEGRPIEALLAAPVASPEASPRARP